MAFANGPTASRATLRRTPLHPTITAVRTRRSLICYPRSHQQIALISPENAKTAVEDRTIGFEQVSFDNPHLSGVAYVQQDEQEVAQTAVKLLREQMEVFILLRTPSFPCNSSSLDTTNVSARR